MTVHFTRLRAALKDFDWNEMFVELGWSRSRKRPEAVAVDGQSWTLAPVAELGGMVVYRCASPNGVLPPSDLRRQVENKVKDIQFEHIIIFEDGERRQAVFQWIKRGEGAAKSREFTVERTPRGELVRGEQLLQRLSGIAFDFNDLDAEGQIGIQPVISKVVKSLDAETITNNFYKEFTTQRNAFQEFLGGIPLDDDQRWYVSVMLNRLMFIYFIQSKHFLNNDGKYLQHKLEESQARGTDLFYREFLQVLFFKGFAQHKNDRDAATKRLLGNVPYLNGGLFLPHQLEETYGGTITIPDAAFVKLFAFFDKWRWHLNERPGLSEREIDPDVLGYIFEKYINQKQMGAYYTKDDITGYICRNTIIPALFDKAKLTLDLLDLPKNIEAYIYPAVKQAERLPTETDREYTARQARKAQLIADGQAGKISTINDAITANLNLEAMAFDLVPFLDARQLWNFYTALSTLSVLDPTCGSGAFLFAAIKILKPLYEQALDRMALLVERRQVGNFAFKQILDAEQAHANRDYFITKSIIVRNLYGVDIMEEATEVCKLRLFLRLVADLRDEDVDRIEPLPDIDFNIRAGNALVGYAKLDEVGSAYKGWDSTRQQHLVRDLQSIQTKLGAYRNAQLQFDPSSDVFRQTRQELRDELKQVNDALNDDLLKIGQIKKQADGGYNTRPFHWFTAFYEILNEGGFDVIVGNPPYIEYAKVRGDQRVNGEEKYRIFGYRTEGCGNLYAPVIERTVGMLRQSGWFSMIVPTAIACTDRMLAVRNIFKLRKDRVWVSHFAIRPSKLFEGVDQRVSIVIATRHDDDVQVLTTKYNKWSAEERPYIFSLLSYAPSVEVRKDVWCKTGSNIAVAVLRRTEEVKTTLDSLLTSRGTNLVYYKNTGVNHWLAVTLSAPKCFRGGELSSSSRETHLYLASPQDAATAFCILNSSLFFFRYQQLTNCRDLNPSDIRAFPVPKNALKHDFSDLARQLSADLEANSGWVIRNQSQTGAIRLQFFRPRLSKPIIDQIDRVLAQHYGFSDEELDFIINYDIKYRMGKDAEEVEA